MSNLKSYNGKIECMNENFLAFSMCHINKIIIKKYKYNNNEIYVSESSLIIDLEIEEFDTVAERLLYFKDNTLIGVFTISDINEKKYNYICKYKIPYDLIHDNVIISKRKLQYNKMHIVSGNNNFLIFGKKNSFLISDISDLNNIKNFDLKLKQELYKLIHINDHIFCAFSTEKIFIFNLETYFKNNILDLQNFEQIDISDISFLKNQKEDKIEIKEIIKLNDAFVFMYRLKNNIYDTILMIYDLKEKEFMLNKKIIIDNDLDLNEIFKINENNFICHQKLAPESSFYENKIICVDNKNIHM